MIHESRKTIFSEFDNKFKINDRTFNNFIEITKDKGIKGSISEAEGVETVGTIVIDCVALLSFPPESRAVATTLPVIAIVGSVSFQLFPLATNSVSVPKV